MRIKVKCQWCQNVQYVDEKSAANFESVICDHCKSRISIIGFALQTIFDMIDTMRIETSNQLNEIKTYVEPKTVKHIPIKEMEKILALADTQVKEQEEIKRKKAENGNR